MKLLLLLLMWVTFIIFPFPARTQIITTIAGTKGLAGYTGDGGPAISATFNHPFGLAVDNPGNIYVFDQLNAVIRKINPAGIISTFAGNGSVGFSGDGGPATSAQIGNHYSGNPAIDVAGNIYFSDAGNQVIRKINTAGIITTVAGNGTFGYSGDGGPARSAQIGPRDLAVDNAGNIYFTDAQSRIRKVSTNGIITTIAGTGNVGFSGDGSPAISANIDAIGIAVDNSDNIYFTDVNTNRVRKINSAGIISTIAGIGIQGYSGDGGPAIAAALKEPYDVHADAFGNIFIAEYNHTIRKINSAGVITTVAGNGTAGYSGDGGPATSAQLHYPVSVWVDNKGDIYIPDFWEHHTIRKVSNCKGIPPTILISPEVSIEPGGSIMLNPQITGTIAEYQWTPPLGLSNPAIANPLASPSITTTYMLKIKSIDGCETEGMTTVTVYKKLFMPSGFTPNGDGRNELFRIPPGTTINLHSFSVYDRSGQIVFTTNDISQGWDGKYKGALLPTGIYVYQLHGEDRSGKVYLKGTVMLVR